MEITGALPVSEPSSSPVKDPKGLQELEREVSPDTTDDEYPLPTADESQTLRRVAGSLPLVSFSLCLVEFAERASYYGAKTVFSNFIEFPLPKGTSCRNPTLVHLDRLLRDSLQAATELVLLREEHRKRLVRWGWVFRHPQD